MDGAGPGRRLSIPLVADLHTLPEHGLAAAGGKAVNLGVLLAGGFPAPPGFCVTTEAYRVASEAAGLDAALAGVDTAGDDREALAAIAARARDALLSAPVPEPVAEAVRDALTRLGTGTAVAVRSSATAEDLPAASFAGQQDTFLDIAGAEEVLAAIRSCWASLWTERAVVYRAAHGVDQRSVSAAVVVQAMVHSVAAGVLFTANPLTGRRREAVIDASAGLGEAVVSGRVNPDHFVVDAHSGRITERRSAAGEPCVTDSQVLAIARLGTAAEEAFGAPQDLEWAIDRDGELWLTQSRPITTLYPVPEDLLDLPRPRVLICASLLQGLTRPLTPMGLAAFHLISLGRSGLLELIGAGREESQALYLDLGGRLYVDLTALLQSPGGRRFIRVFKVSDARSAAALESLLGDPRFPLVKAPRRKVLRGLLTVAQVLHPADIVRQTLKPAAAGPAVDRAAARLSAALAFPADAPAAARLDGVERVLGKEIVTAIWDMIAPMEAGFACLGLVQLLLKGQLQRGDLETVLRGLPHNVTTEMDLELWAVAVRLREDAASAADVLSRDPADLARAYTAGRLPAVAQAAVRGFLDRYGHRAVAEIDLGVQRWSEDPSHLFGVLANYLRLEDPQLAPDLQFARAAEQAEAKVAELTARAASRSRLRGKVVALALRRTRELAGMRELPKFHLIVAFAALRRELDLVGAELAAAGRIAVPQDIYFLDLAEARVGLRGAGLAEMVAARRREYDQEMRRRYIPRVLLTDGTDLEAALPRPAGASGDLAGTPASAGTVTGRAKVVFDPVGAHLEPGEILVVPSADPGWTPLFLTAGGLVMEMGGSVSHASVIAREYGIPAVVSVRDATTRIATGSTITVDGSAGTVRLES